MRSPQAPKAFALSIAALTLGCASTPPQPQAGQPVTQIAHSAQPDTSFYTSKVQPILKANCYRCHGGMNHRGSLTLDTKAGLLKGGHDGTVLVPGHPEQSMLIQLIRHEGPPKDPMPMPPKSKLSDADIATVTQWVKDGAVMPE